MKISEILNHCDPAKILPAKLTVETDEGDYCATMEMDGSDRDCAVLIEVSGNVIRVANRDIPNFVAALAMFCREDLF